jgi:DNA topoisomerase-1
MLAFAAVLPSIRRQTRRDLMGPACSRPRVLATVVQLLEHTHIRIGNEEYARCNHSHGLTTLLDRHVSIRGGRHLRFAFRGKSGVQQTIDLENPHLAKAVQQCQDLPGQTLFQYRDERRKVKSVSSADVNRYLQAMTGGSFTAKDFRTWAGTLAAAAALARTAPAKSTAGRNRAIVQAVDTVAGRLGNTRAVCRKCYIHPAVLDAYHAGTTLGDVSRSRARHTAGLREAEARLVALLTLQSKKKAA